jgi:FkbM family methyltransferase
MWTRINRGLKRRLPGLHAVLKGAAGRWMRSRDPWLPGIRRIAGDWVWVHPRILTSEIARSEPHIVRWMDAWLRPGDTFFDVGANCGWLSLHAAKRVGRGGHIVAFEPSPILAEFLAYHRRVNRAPQIHVVPKAVSDSDGAAQFFLIQEGFSTRNSLTIGGDVPFLRTGEKTAISVPAITLDSYCGATGDWPSLVKIDVEGAELMVLRGAAQVLERRPVLIVGSHPHLLPPGQTTGDIFRLLSGQGYVILESEITQYAGFEGGDYLMAPPRHGQGGR